MQFDNFRRAYDAPPDRKWEVDIMQRLRELYALSEDWDGYGGAPLRHDVGMFALCLLKDVMRPRTPIPRLVPTPRGGLQLEWHEKDIDLELHVSAPYECELWFEDHRTGAHSSLEFDTDISELTKPVALLSAR